MILTTILLIGILILFALLYIQFQTPDLDGHVLPKCRYKIENLSYTSLNKTRISKFSISSLHHYFFDYFPLGFKFYSSNNCKAKIKISYNELFNDNKELIYNKNVNFDKDCRQYIYYISDVIIGSIDIELVVEVENIDDVPIIGFEILQNNKCYIVDAPKIEIIFKKK